MRWSASSKMDLPKMRLILADRLGIQAGDAILVHSSFGSLNAKFSPQDLIQLLKNIVTPSGLIVMPYYPPIPAVDWLEHGHVFDHVSSPSAMGVLTTQFKNDPAVFISIHPIKALAAWGQGAKQFVADHDLATTPFDAASPYAKLKQLPNAKSIGLGIERCTFYHHCEDVLLISSLGSRYLTESFRGSVRTRTGQEVEVTTLVHDPIAMGARELSCSIFRRHNCPTYVGMKVQGCAFYSVSIPAAFKFLEHFWRSSPSEPNALASAGHGKSQ